MDVKSVYGVKIINPHRALADLRDSQPDEERRAAKCPDNWPGEWVPREQAHPMRNVSHAWCRMANGEVAPHGWHQLDQSVVAYWFPMPAEDFLAVPRVRHIPLKLRKLGLGPATTPASDR